MENGARGFDAAVLGTSYNARDLGVRPRVLVQANTIDDVVAAVKRAGRENLKISICSGGHSWAQNHLRDGGLMLDLSRLDELQIDVAGRRAIAGPGNDGSRVNARLMKHGLFFPVAHCPGVGLGGFLLQGGFGWNSRALGLGCESVSGIDVVLADGRLVHANERENADIFWAARGAGPGFFGVVVRFHLRLHPMPKFVGMVLQVFRMKHLEEVFSWAETVAPDVSRAVEFQILLTSGAFGLFAPGIEVAVPVLANSWKEAREATAYLTESPIRKKASIALPLLPVSIGLMQRGAARTHFPDGMHWCVDNMWTNSAMAQLLPGLRRVADTLPPSPSHALWLNWRPPASRGDMAFSVEANTYIALYGEWRRAADDAKYANWATDHMQAMASMSAGIQLADENLGKRPARFLSDTHMARLDRLRATHDPAGRFHSYRGRL
ncbi:MAG: FAD-binding oxidoreductase [Alphaproteobacteria bacterium]|nr:FAD-binding oxidoreductase [Alphaproteobacteria bacterium]